MFGWFRSSYFIKSLNGDYYIPGFYVILLGSSSCAVYESNYSTQFFGDAKMRYDWSHAKPTYSAVS